MKPDLAKLQAIRGEITNLGEAGKLTRVEFDRLYALAHEAANNEAEYLEGIETAAIWYGVKL